MANLTIDRTILIDAKTQGSYDGLAHALVTFAKEWFSRGGHVIVQDEFDNAEPENRQTFTNFADFESFLER